MVDLKPYWKETLFYNLSSTLFGTNIKFRLMITQLMAADLLIFCLPPGLRREPGSKIVKF